MAVRFRKNFSGIAKVLKSNFQSLCFDFPSFVRERKIIEGRT